MKISKLLFASALVGGVFLSSCEKAPVSESDMNKAVSFSSSIANQVSSRAVNNAWENNDAIGVFMKTGTGLANATASNKQYVTVNTSGSFTASSTDNQIFYPADASAVDFIAYYPYQASLSGTTYKVNLADQSQPNKIDLLYADNAKGLTKSSSNAALNFSHKLAKMEITVSAGSKNLSLSGLAVQYNGFNTTADFDLGSGVMSNAAAPTAFNALVTAGTSTTSTAEAILLPAADAIGKTIVFKLGANSYTWKLPETTSFVAGNKYAYNIQLSNDANGLTVVVMESNIVGWTDVPSGSHTIVKDNDGGSTDPGTPGTGTEQVLFTETMGTADVTTRPKVAAYTGWANASFTYSDQFGAADVRSTATLDNNLWLPANKNSELSIAGISTAGTSGLKLSFKMLANSGKDQKAADLINVTLNGQAFTPADVTLSGSNTTYVTVTVDMSSATSLPASSTLVIGSTPEKNTVGVRIDDIQLSGVTAQK